MDLNQVVSNLPYLPLGDSDFELLRQNEKIYVDKTALVYELACTNHKVFLARPRRFGKSLLISTFYSLFKYGLRDFKDLAIEKLWQDHTKYTVMRLDFSCVANFKDAKDFDILFNSYLIEDCLPEAFRPKGANGADGIGAFRRWLKSQPRGSVVLLIDEYDAPLTACLNESENFQDIRSTLAYFYSALRSNEGAFRFLFLTGITKFGNTGIFSQANNLWDITLSPEFGTIVGYTLEELKHYFGGYIAKVARLLKISEEGLVEKLTVEYSGFCFERTATKKVFAPWSILNFFISPSNGFFPYWYESAGQPSILVQYITDLSLLHPSEFDRKKDIPIEQLSAWVPSNHMNDLVLLEQTGYLTIKRSKGHILTLGYPNQEVSDSIASLYLRRLLWAGKSITDVMKMDFSSVLARRDIPEFVRLVNAVFVLIDYHRYTIRDESSCAGILLIALKVSGIQAYWEMLNAFDRNDIAFTLSDVHWVLELKFAHKNEDIDKLLFEGEMQTEDRQYGKQAVEEKQVRLVMVFSEEKRQFVKYAVLDSA